MRRCGSARTSVSSTGARAKRTTSALEVRRTGALRLERRGKPQSVEARRQRKFGFAFDDLYRLLSRWWNVTFRFPIARNRDVRLLGDERSVLHSVADAIKGTAYAGQMPAYVNELINAEFAAVLDHERKCSL